MQNHKVYITKKNLTEGSEQRYLCKEVIVDDENNTEEIRIYTEGDTLIERIVNDRRNNHFYYENFVIPIRTFTETIINKDGKTKEETEFDYENKAVLMNTKYQYDSHGNCIKQIVMHEGLIETYDYKYDSDLRTMEVSHYVNDKLNSITKNTRDGSIETSLTLDPFGKQIQKRVKESTADKSHEVEYDYNDLPASISELEYNGNHDLLLANIYDGDHKLLKSIAYSYDEQNRVTLETESEFKEGVKISEDIMKYEYNFYTGN